MQADFGPAGTRNPTSGENRFARNARTATSQDRNLAKGNQTAEMWFRETPLCCRASELRHGLAADCFFRFGPPRSSSLAATGEELLLAKGTDKGQERGLSFVSSRPTHGFFTGKRMLKRQSQRNLAERYARLGALAKRGPWGVRC